MPPNSPIVGIRSRKAWIADELLEEADATARRATEKPVGRTAEDGEGWLPPCLQSRMANILTWVARLSRLCRITNIIIELVRFDMQLMENAEISGTEYQQGTLAGYGVREYLLEKWGRKCTYCDKENIPLQIEHINPRANGGTNRISNLCLACEKCNKAKGTKDIKDWLSKKPNLLKKILAQAKAPLKDAAAVNATRWELFRRLQGFGFPIRVRFWWINQVCAM